MKFLLVSTLLTCMFCFTGYSQCSLKCNLTSSYICPDSKFYNSNKKIFNDAELMTELGYSKDEKGYWKFYTNYGNKQIFKSKEVSGQKKQIKKWYKKVKKLFHTTVTGL